MMEKGKIKFENESEHFIESDKTLTGQKTKNAGRLMYEGFSALQKIVAEQKERIAELENEIAETKEALRIEKEVVEGYQIADEQNISVGKTAQKIHNDLTNHLLRENLRLKTELAELRKQSLKTNCFCLVNTFDEPEPFIEHIALAESEEEAWEEIEKWYDIEEIENFDEKYQLRKAVVRLQPENEK